MKKIIALLILSFAFITSYSQIQEVKAGLIFVPQATTNGRSFDLNNMDVVTPLLGNVLVVTKKSYHNICYVLGGNALVLVNGLFYNEKKDQDVYFVFTKNFANSGGNLLFAWEIQLTEGPIPAWFAIEVGTSWETWDTSIFNLSLTIPFNRTIWKNKPKTN